ncbi:MAG: energy-coupling factor transporter transmembrane component T [Deltaproteobacteria bacterium]
MALLGQYFPGNSLLHRLDPRVKIAGTVLLSIAILRGTVAGWSGNTVFLAVLFAVAGLPVRSAAQALRPIRFFLLFLFLIHLFFTPGESIGSFSWGIVTITYAGLFKGGTVVWQICLLLWSAALLTATTSPEELIAALDRLLRPLAKVGFPSSDIATMVSIALGFFPVFVREMEKIKEAQEARGADFKGGTPLKRAKVSGGILVPLLFSIKRRAEELAVAMEARGYCRGPRSSLRELRMTLSDFAALGITVLVLGFPFLAKMYHLHG